MNYCGLVDAKIRASDKDLPVGVVKYLLVSGLAKRLSRYENNS